MSLKKQRSAYIDILTKGIPENLRKKFHKQYYVIKQVDADGNFMENELSNMLNSINIEKKLHGN